MKKRVIILMVVSSVLILFSSNHLFAMKIGYADMEVALAATKAGKKAKQKIEEEVSKRRKSLEKSRSEIVKLEEDFKKQEMILSEASKEKKKEEYLKKVDDLRNLVAQNEQQMQEIQQKIASPILVKMREVLQKISKAQGYDMVFAKNALVYASDENDLTAPLIKQFDKEY